MHQLISSAEACELLDRILVTIQTLNETRGSLQEKAAPKAIVATPLPPTVVRRPRVLPDPAPVAPVLTIKLSDLVREGAAARERRAQHARPQRQPKRPPPPPPRSQLPRLPPLREVRTIEVVYKRQRMAS